MADSKKLMFLRQFIITARRRRNMLQQSLLAHSITRRRRVIFLVICLCALLLSSAKKSEILRVRSCRRLTRNKGWWETVRNYSERMFKRTLRISKATFQYILGKIEHNLQRQFVTEEPIAPDCRLAICLYLLARGDYCYTVSQMTGYGVSTVSTIVDEVCEAIINNLWDECVACHFPTTVDQFKEKLLDFDELWQFPWCWGAIDGCHIPIKCPKGGSVARKEYYNFKNFYSVVLLAIVDAKYRFIWGSCGFPGNCHDSIIFQSTDLFEKIHQGTVIPNIGQDVDGISVSPLIVGDSAFPSSTWLVKPYTNATLSTEQRYFNYRLSRARMVIEGAYGQLKGRWRVLLRKSEMSPEKMKIVTLACMVLHNICLELGDTISKKLDLTEDPVNGERRDRETISQMLQLCQSCPTRDTNRQAYLIREKLSKKCWEEKQGHLFC